MKMNTTTTITNKQIREHFLADPRNLEVKISRGGSGGGRVTVKTTRFRGDGGRIPWRMFAGNKDEVIRDITESRNP